ncbi:MAG: hypothetical protein ABW278_12460 [Steroidobacteraceae bacterium]
MLRHAIAAMVAAAAFTAAVQPVVAAQKPGDNLPITSVQDLHYGDVLFQAYMGEDLEALTRLEAYSQWHLIPHHEGEAELLAGGLYLQLGMHNEAGRRFESLLVRDIPATVRGRAWFYLAKVWYTRGYFDRTVDSLRRIDGKLAPAQQAERVHLEGNALMRLGRYDEAIALLSTWTSPSSWLQFARFNIGVALMRNNRIADGTPILDTVGMLATTDPELLDLKDKANLALGFAWLQANEPARAMGFLERVRLNGPQSNRALLGLGWAHTTLGQHEAALTPLLELRDRNLLDAAVQEAYLAVPYAFAQLGAAGQAAQYYEQALTSFAAERGRIDASEARIREGSLLSNLLGADDAGSTQLGWFWQLQALPDEPETRYLFPVLAGNEFQEGLKNYRDLAYLGSTLARWDENMVVYSDMIDAREKAYAERTPRVDALLAANPLEQLTAQRQAAAGRMNQIVNAEDVAALGGPAERAQWERVMQLEDALESEPEGAETEALRDKLRLVKGVLYWNLRQNYPERLYQQRRELQSLDRALADAGSRWLRVQQARREAPTTTGDFAARIAQLQQRMTALRAALAGAAADQSGLLAGIAIGELDAQKARIEEYEIQARFALATLYDQAADGATRPPARPAGAKP